MSLLISKFKKYPLVERKREILNIKQKHPDKCPIFIAKLDTDKILPDISKNKYLIPFDFTISQLMYTIRKNMNISPETAIFLFICNIVATGNSKVVTLYEEYKNEDGFLYITYAGENTFG